jgi:hypothetical protein
MNILKRVCVDDHPNGNTYSTKDTGMMHKTHKYGLNMRGKRHFMKEDIWSVFCIYIISFSATECLTCNR